MEWIKNSVKKYPKVEIAKVVNGNWLRELAASKYSILLKKHTEIDIVWTASDSMALGVINQATKYNLQANTDYVIGVFDWLPEAIIAIKNGNMTASVGGHFMQGAWALTKIYDHHQGKNVFKVDDDTPYVSMQVIDKNNVGYYISLADTLNLDNINFAEFSLSHTANKSPELGYQFTMEAFMASYQVKP